LQQHRERTTDAKPKKPKEKGRREQGEKDQSNESQGSARQTGSQADRNRKEARSNIEIRIVERPSRRTLARVKKTLRSCDAERHTNFSCLHTV